MLRAFAIKRLQRLDLGRRDKSAVKALEVDMHLDLSLVESAQSWHGEAVWRAEKAWEVAFTGADLVGRVADLKFGFGVALANGGR